MNEDKKLTLARREVVKGLATAVAAAVLPTAAQARGRGTPPLPPPTDEPTDIPRGARNYIVYRLKPRRTSHCYACGKHHKYTLAISPKLMDQNRAHVGCNCPIDTQEISADLYHQLFDNNESGIARRPRPGK